MSCDGHMAHHFEPTNECAFCGHDRDEHEDDGFWPEDRGKRPEPWEQEAMFAYEDEHRDDPERVAAR